MKYCKNCGFEMKDEETICSFCGKDQATIIEKPVMKVSAQQVEKKAPTYDTYQPYFKDQEVKEESFIGYEINNYSWMKHLIIGLGMFLGYQVLASILIVLTSFILKTTGASIDEAAANRITDIISVASEFIAIGIVALVMRHEIKQIFTRFDKKNWKIVGIALLVMLGFNYFYSFILQILHIDVSSSNQDSVNSTITSLPLVGFLFVCVAAPLLEELVFRFGIFRAIAKWNEKAAIGIVTLLFAGVHMISSIQSGTLLEDLTSLPVYLSGAFVLTFTYYKSKNIAASIAAHSIYNTYSFIMILIASILPAVR